MTIAGLTGLCGDDSKGRKRRLATSLLVVTAGLALLAAGCRGPMDEARELESKDDLAGAVEVYRQVLAEDPDNAEALEEAAIDLVMLGRHDEALELQERLVLVDPSDVQTRIELGFNYLNHQKRPDDAARVLGEAAALEPSAKNLCFLAQAQIAGDDAVRAEEILRQAIAQDPTYAYSYTILISLLSSQGREEEASQVARQAAAQGVTLSGP